MDTRFRQRDWILPVGADGCIRTWDAVKVAILMDLRDELQNLRRSQMLQCDVACAIKSMLVELRGLRRDLKMKKKKRTTNDTQR